MTALATVFAAIQTKLATLTTFKGQNYAPRHPDFTTAWPALYLEWGDETRDYSGSDRRKIIPSSVLAECRIHIQRNSWTDQPSLQLLRDIATIEAAIQALTTADSTTFNCWVSRTESAIHEGGQWAWAVITIQIGSYQ